MNRSVVVAGVVLLLCAILGMFGVHRFVAAEGERDLHQWQVRLGIVAASRAQAVRNGVTSSTGLLPNWRTIYPYSFT